MASCATSAVMWRGGPPVPATGGSAVAASRASALLRGPFFHRSRTPLTIWFEAVCLPTTQSYGASALSPQRVLGLGSYQTVWTMLHKFRAAMVDPNRTPLDGVVEGDEVFIGGKKKAGKP